MNLPTPLKTLANEPAVILGVIVAAVNGATDQSWKGYAVAVAIALLRFVVTGPLSAKTTPVVTLGGTATTSSGAVTITTTPPTAPPTNVTIVSPPAPTPPAPPAVLG